MLLRDAGELSYQLTLVIDLDTSLVLVANLLVLHLVRTMRATQHRIQHHRRSGCSDNQADQSNNPVLGSCALRTGRPVQQLAGEHVVERVRKAPTPIQTNCLFGCVYLLS